MVQLASRHWQALAGVDAQNYVEDVPYNYAVNAAVRPVTPLAVASAAPVRPARYRGRCADTERNEQEVIGFGVPAL